MTTHLDCITYLVAACPEANFPQASQRLYLRELSVYPPDLLMQAVRLVCATRVYPSIPPMGEIHNAVAHVKKRQVALPDAFQAWGEVIRELGRGKLSHVYLCDEAMRLRKGLEANSNYTLKDIADYMAHFKECDLCYEREDAYQFSHPIVQQVLTNLGMTQLDGDNEGVQRAHFVKAYQEAVKRMDDEALPVLGGRTDYALPPGGE